MLKKLQRFWKRPKKTSGYVYYAKLMKGGEAFYWIGFTYAPSLIEHISSNHNGNEKLLEKEFFFTYRNDGWDVTQDLLDCLDKKRKFGRYGDDHELPLYRSGQKDLFSYDVLGLDSALYELSDAAKESQKDAGLGCLFVLIGLALIPFTAGISIVVILVIIGVMTMHDYVVNHGNELDEKKPPKLPKKMQRLVNTLSPYRDNL